MNILQESFDYGQLRFISVSGTLAISSDAGRHSSDALFGTGYGYIPITASGDTVIVGVAIRPEFLAPAGEILAIGNEVGPQLILKHETSAAISAYRGSTLIVSSAPNAIHYGEYSQVEIRATLGDAGADVEIRVAGVGTILTFSDDTIDSGSSTPSRVYLYPLGIHYFDDLFVNDTSGVDNNDFLGDMRIDAHLPDADDSIQWTRSTGSLSYDNVNELVPNEDADYNYTLSSGLSDHYGVQPLIARQAGIKAVSLLQRTRTVTSGPATVRGSVRSGGVNYPQSPTHTLTSGYEYYETIFERDPATSVEFTDSSFDAASWGPNRTT